jgi:hypothetical protein
MASGVLLIHGENPLSNTTLGIVVTPAVLGIIPADAVGVQQRAVDVELDALLDGELVGANGPVDLRLLAAVEAVNVDKGAPGAAEELAEVGLGGEGADDGGDGAGGTEGGDFFEAGAVGVAGQGADGVVTGLDEVADDGDALGAGAADAGGVRMVGEDMRVGMDSHCDDLGHDEWKGWSEGL